MVGRTIQAFLGIFVCAGWLGCAPASSRVGYPDDPLLVCKQPVTGKPGVAGGPLLAFSEPVPPPLPPEAFVLAGRARKHLSTSPQPETLTQKNSPSPEEAPETNQGAAKPNGVQAIPVSRRKPAAYFGHSPDYTWLQGIIALSPNNRMELSYCESNEKDIWGGRVILGNDARLASLRTGDIVRVEGEILAEGDMPAADNLADLPVYRIKSVHLLRDKE